MSLGGLRDPRDPEPRHVLAARGGRGRLRGLERRGRRRRGRERRPGARRARGRSRAIRPRSRTCSASARSSDDGRVPAFSNRDPIYNDIAAPGPGHPLDLPAAADRRASELRGAGLLELRAGGVPRGRGDVVRRAAGDARPPRSCSALRPTLAARAGDGAPRADGASTSSAATGCRACAARPRRVLAAGARLDVAAAIERARQAAPAARPLRAERRRRRRRRTPLVRRERADRRRRSTSGTTRTTSTRSSCGREPAGRTSASTRRRRERRPRASRFWLPGRRDRRRARRGLLRYRVAARRRARARASTSSYRPRARRVRTTSR